MTSCKRPWPVLVVCCCLGFNALGMMMGLGAIFTDIMDTFGVSRTTASLVQSLITGFVYLGGIFSGHFLRSWGPRTAVITGSVLATVGCIIAFLANHIVQVIVGIGVITGSGIALNFMTYLTLPGIVFHDIKSLAMAVNATISAIGTIVYPLLLRHATGHYSVRGTFLIMASINCQLILCGAIVGLYVPRAHQEETACLMTAGRQEKDSIPDSLLEIKHDETAEKYADDSKLNRESLLEKSDNTCPSGNDARKTIPRSWCSFHTIRNAMSMLLELFRDPRFFVVSVFGGTVSLLFPLPWMFMTDMIKSNNLSVEDGSSFITVLFVGSLTGRVLSGFLYKLLKSWIQIIPGVATVIGGISCLLFAFCKSYVHFVVVSLFHGLGYGLLSCTVTMAFLEILGPGRFAVGTGYGMFFVGIFLLLSGPYGGLIRDLTNSYEPLYHIALVHGLVIGAVMLFVNVRHLRQS